MYHRHRLLVTFVLLTALGSAQRQANAQAVTGSGTVGQLARWTSANSIGNSILLTQSGAYFGVGTATPLRELHLTGVLRIDRTNTPGIYLHQQGQKTFFVGMQASGVNQGEFFIGDVGSAVSGVGTKRLVINNAGNVGIGVLNPVSKLSVAGVIQSTTGGIRFPDNTTQVTATLVGPQGPSGQMGPPGAAGAAGPQGNPGVGIRAAGTNTAVGLDALPNVVNGNGNTAVGFEALKSTQNSPNTAIGLRALTSNTSGLGNTAVGTHALLHNSTGNFNVAIGNVAVEANTTGHHNIGVGSGALYRNNNGQYNVALGNGALGEGTTLDNNIAVGHFALELNNSSPGSGGFDNVAIGSNALRYNTTGAHNIAVGSEAGVSVTGGQLSIFIGNRGLKTDSNVIRIGNAGSQRTAFVAGINGANVPSGVGVLVDSNGQLGTLSSSQRYKEEIISMGDSSSALTKLRPVTFRYKKSSKRQSGPLEYGLIAEEVAEVYPDAVTYLPSGEPEAVQYHKINAMLLNEFQRQHEDIQALKDRIAQLESLLHSRTSK